MHRSRWRIFDNFQRPRTTQYSLSCFALFFPTRFSGVRFRGLVDLARGL